MSGASYISTQYPAICIAVGEQKAEAVLGAVRGNYIGTLIMDDKCAQKILKTIK
ncbi:MAG: hypothetical protein HFH22_11880 [Ruminococcus sp.]|nr:hypothetical protein [Ruminococcus sp.]MCI9330451.1 hypothetical protein [Ruminococcus sp.]NBJ00085.1 hypothetical protein [Lachnospiraceae bacterium]